MILTLNNDALPDAVQSARCFDAADGVATRAIAREVNCAIGTAAKWRVRYVNDRAIEPCD